MTENRIEVLKDILLRLHHGADADSVQEDFNQTFKGVSALEISMMEHELMGDETGITFEDVMGCVMSTLTFLKELCQMLMSQMRNKKGILFMYLSKKISLYAQLCCAFAVLLKTMRNLKMQTFVMICYVV